MAKMFVIIPLKVLVQPMHTSGKTFDIKKMLKSYEVNTIIYIIYPFKLND